jgi:antirestriction protein ArdC
MMREYTVFNVDQCDGLPDTVRAGRPMRVRNPDARDALADQFLQSTGAEIREGNGEAYYAPGHDFISLPAFQSFNGADHFYNVAFHELTHWTGHKSRLDRDLKHRFGDRAYAAEELVAELGAAFLAAEFGFDGDVRSAGYIASWIDLLKSDKRAFFTAASKASKAADYLRRLALADGSADAPAPYSALFVKEASSGQSARSSERKQWPSRTSGLSPRPL